MKKGGNDKASAQFTPILHQALPGLTSALVLGLFLPERWSALAIIPFYVMNTFFCKTTIPLGLLVSTVYVGWLSPIYMPFKIIFGLSWNVFWLMFYLHLVIILARYGYDSHNLLGVATVKALFEPPLLITMRIVHHLFGGRFFMPFTSVIDNRLVVGSMPFASDVSYLVNNLRVGAVINMCSEYKGPQKQYAAQGVAQLRLPTHDTSAPRREDLLAGARWAQRFLAEEAARAATEEGRAPRRVLVHCKGGVGRAATMALAFLMVEDGVTPEEGWRLLKSRRKVVSHSVLEFHATREIAAQYSRPLPSVGVEQLAPSNNVKFKKNI